MYPVSQAFIDAVHGSSMVVAVRVTTTSGIPIVVDGGSVTMDSRRSIQRACDLTILPADLSAAELYQLLMTPNVELKVERGLVINGTPIYVPLGIFSTDSCEYDRDNGGPVSFNGSDRAKKISRARFVEPYQIAAGTPLATAGAALLEDRWASVDYDFSAVYETVTAQLVFEPGSNSNPWDLCRDLFADHGYDLHFDGNGVCRATPIPDPGTTRAVFSFGSGETNMVLGATTKGSLDETYNGVVASGEGSDVATAVRYAAWDEDPLSPTYVGNGQVPYFYSSPLLTTVELCQKAAETLLSKVKGSTEQLSWPSIVNPALEPLDVVTLSVNGQTSTCIVDSLTIPLNASDSMTATARETRRS